VERLRGCRAGRARGTHAAVPVRPHTTPPSAASPSAPQLQGTIGRRAAVHREFVDVRQELRAAGRRRRQPAARPWAQGVVILMHVAPHDGARPRLRCPSMRCRNSAAFVSPTRSSPAAGHRQPDWWCRHTHAMALAGRWPKPPRARRGPVRSGAPLAEPGRQAVEQQRYAQPPQVRRNRRARTALRRASRAAWPGARRDCRAGTAPAGPSAPNRRRKCGYPAGVIPGTRSPVTSQRIRWPIRGAAAGSGASAAVSAAAVATPRSDSFLVAIEVAGR